MLALIFGAVARLGHLSLSLPPYRFLCCIPTEGELARGVCLVFVGVRT